jgi:hypothetical protein
VSIGSVEPPPPAPTYMFPVSLESPIDDPTSVVLEAVQIQMNPPDLPDLAASSQWQEKLRMDELFAQEPKAMRDLRREVMELQTQNTQVSTDLKLWKEAFEAIMNNI